MLTNESQQKQRVKFTLLKVRSQLIKTFIFLFYMLKCLFPDFYGSQTLMPKDRTIILLLKQLKVCNLYVLVMIP